MVFTTRPLVLFEDKPHFFNMITKENLRSPVFHLRASGSRADNKNFWAAMGDIYCDPDEPASGVIEKHGIIDRSQQNELRYRGALVRLLQGRPFEEVTELHGVGDRGIKDMLLAECVTLNELQKGSRVFRHAFEAVYIPDIVSDVIKLSAITDREQQASLRRHACMFYIRRGMLAHELTEYFDSPEAERSIFREACRQEIEEGKSAPEAIIHQGMKNEDDKALMRLIGAAEDIQEGMSITEAARRNKVPEHQIGRLDRLKRELAEWRYSDDVLDSLPENYLQAPETTEVHGGGPRGTIRKRSVQKEDGMPPTKRPRITQVDRLLRNPLVKAKGSERVIRRLNDSGSKMVKVDFVLNERDELVPEGTLASAGLKRESSFGEQSSATQNGTSKDPIDLTEVDNIQLPPGAPPAKRARQFDRRSRSSPTVLD